MFSVAVLKGIAYPWVMSSDQVTDSKTSKTCCVLMALVVDSFVGCLIYGLFG